MECGTTCLAMIFKYYGFYNVRNILAKLAHVSTEGTDLYTISEIAESMGFETDGYQLKYDDINQLNLPCIAHYDGNHFVVIYKATNSHIWIADPAYGKDRLTKEEFSSKWNGIVLNMIPREDLFQNKDMLELIDERKARLKDTFKNFYLAVLSPFKKVFSEILLASFVLQIVGLALPFFTQAIIDNVLVSQNKQLLFAILLGMICIFFTQIILTYARNVLLNQFKVQLELNFFSRFFQHFISLRQSFFDAYKREDFINRFQENLKIRQFLNPSILQSSLDFTFIITYLIILFIYNSFLALTALIFMVVYVGTTVYFTPRLKQLENKVFHENVKTMGQFLDTLLGIQNVKLLGIEKLKFWKWKNQYTKALNKVLTTEQTYINLSTLLSAIAFFSQAAVYWTGAYLAFQQEMTIGQYIAFITIFTVVINSVTNLSNLWFLFTELSVSYERLNDILVEPSEKIDITESLPIPREKNDIEFKKLNFKYQENREDWVLEDINLKIETGSFIGIVGRNGSGKSTLVKLIARLYDSYEGKLTVGGLELRSHDPFQYRKRVAVIPQDIYLFDGTIKENILYGNPQATDEEVIEASKKAQLHDFVKENYLGYNLKIGENGMNLSGGQKLRIAFARLFVSNPEIIILDEASSALDLESEASITKNLLEHFKGKTIISVAHRLSTVKNCDEILVMDKGQIVERGSHDQLVKSGGIYEQFLNAYLNI